MLFCPLVLKLFLMVLFNTVVFKHFGLEFNVIIEIRKCCPFYLCGPLCVTYPIAFFSTCSLQVLEIRAIP